MAGICCFSATITMVNLCLGIKLTQARAGILFYLVPKSHSQVRITKNCCEEVKALCLAALIQPVPTCTKQGWSLVAVHSSSAVAAGRKGDCPNESTEEWWTCLPSELSHSSFRCLERIQSGKVELCKLPSAGLDHPSLNLAGDLNSSIPWYTCSTWYLFLVNVQLYRGYLDGKDLIYFCHMEKVFTNKQSDETFLHHALKLCCLTVLFWPPNNFWDL